MIDTASIYENEEGVGRGIKRSEVPREEIFVTTKLWTDDFDNAEEAIETSLKKLDIEYIDLMILHHAAENDIEAYQVLEDAVEEGKIKSIGVSNYSIDDFERLTNAVNIEPAVLQNESHPYHQELDMKQFLLKYGTKFESWFPLGGRANHQELFSDPTIESLARKYNKTSAQIILRWQLQSGSIAIPGSSNAEHIKENINIFDFELSSEEMQEIYSLNQNQRFSDF